MMNWPRRSSTSWRTVASLRRSARAAISLGPALEQVDTEGFEDSDDLPITGDTFHRIQESLRRLYMDATVPKEVRRRVLEGSVRAPQTWHRDATRAAFASDDDAWKLTAVFCMRFVKGFDDQIMEALNSTDPATYYARIGPQRCGAAHGAR